jgi:putative transferase (TIGR04331 family)
MINRQLYVTEFDKNFVKEKIQEEDYFLGQWCFNQIQEEKNFNIIKFHWSNLKKRKKDYLYLEELRKRILKILCQKINAHHNVKKSNRYWVLLLDPWLSSYLSIMFDRWENLTFATKTYNFNVNFYKGIIKKNSHFLFEIPSFRASDALYNQLIYQRLYKENFFIKKLKISYKTFHIGKNFSKSNFFKKKTYIKLFFLLIFQFIERLFLNKRAYSNYFIYPFSSLSLGVILKFKFFCKIKVLFFFNEIYDIEKKLNLRLKTSIQQSTIRKQKLKFITKNNFEKFLVRYILNDLPSAIIEDYKFTLKHIKKINLNPNTIIASANYWDTFSFKLWIAEMTEIGKLFFINDHGRGLIPFDELLNFENDMCNIKLSWHKPINNKQIQVPALRYSNFKLKKFHSSRYCSVVGLEANKNINMINFYALSSEAIKTYFQIVNFYKLLNTDIKNNFLLKPRKYSKFEGSWDLESFFKKKIGKDKIYDGLDYDKFISNSKIIICTYPLTTLSDAITLNKPTILLLPKSTYFFHPRFKKIISMMKKNKILFYESSKAAKHINQIWNNPEEWWNSSRVMSVKKEYKKNFCQYDGNSLNNWFKILEKKYDNKKIT